MKISDSAILKALQCLEDNGIDHDECPTVLQALIYILMDEEIDEERMEVL